jgi:transcriptional regulator with XRE-family HTH domain
MVTRMKIERVKRGWSQGRLSQVAEVAAGDVSRIETGRMRPYPTQAERLANVLGIPPEELQQPVQVEAAS